MATFSWAFVLSAFAVIVALSVASPFECTRQFSVEVDGQKLMISTICMTTFGRGLGAREFSQELQAPPEFSRIAVRPLVRISSYCSHTVDVSGIINTTHYTLLVEAQAVEQNTNDHGPMWDVDLPEYFTDVHCVDIHIKGSPVGPIHELRRQVLVKPLGQITPELLCLNHGEELCEVLDMSSYDQLSTIALMRNGTQYYIEYLNSGHMVFLPKCQTTTATTSHVTPQWVLLYNTACVEEDTVSFTPRRVHAASLNELYISSDGGLLYSPNKGISLYQLLLPDSMETINSFALSSDSTFACATTGNETSGIWLGFVGSSELVQIYPSTLLDKLWEASGTQWNDSTLQNSTLEFNSQNELCLIEGSNTVTFPLPLLVSSAQETNITELDFLDLHNLITISQHSNLVTNVDHLLCPFMVVVTEAPVCSVITRSKLEVISSGALRWIDEYSLPQKNCSVSSNDLPIHFFLGKSESYKFVVHFIQSPRLYGPDGLYYIAHVSSPEVLGVEMTKSYHDVNNTVTYHVTIREKNHFVGQFPSGYTNASVDVDLEVWGASHACVQPLSGPELKIPGRLKTRVHVGCPPGLSLVFDAKTTSGKYTQYCRPDNNISCYYFNNEFHPVFELVDSVTGEKSIYIGSYTLTAIAGGTRLGHMQSFNRNKNIESELWTPVKLAYSYTDNKIQWVCGTASPCGEIVPHSGNIPEYYLLMEASNLFVAANETYCDLTVHFMVRIHGMGMGSVTVVVTLMCLLAVMLVVTVLLFGMWHFRLKLFYFRDRTLEYCAKRFNSTRRAVVEYIREHKTRVHPTNSS